MSSLAMLWIFLVSTQFICSFTLDDPQMIRTKDFKISSKHFNLTNGTGTGMRTNTGKVGTVNSKTQKELLEKKIIISTEKKQKGIGSYGGGNVVHRRPPQKGAAVVLMSSPSFFISSTNIVGLTFFFLVVLPLRFA